MRKDNKILSAVLRYIGIAVYFIITAYLIIIHNFILGISVSDQVYLGIPGGLLNQTSSRNTLLFLRKEYYRYIAAILSVLFIWIIICLIYRKVSDMRKHNTEKKKPDKRILTVSFIIAGVNTAAVVIIGILCFYKTNGLISDNKTIITIVRTYYGNAVFCVWLAYIEYIAGLIILKAALSKNDYIKYIAIQLSPFLLMYFIYFPYS